MKIRLTDISEEGRIFEFTRATGELNSAVSDLLDKADYKVRIHIRKLGNAFELKGQWQSSIADLCSQCGWEIEVPLQQNLTEILIEEEDVDRKGHSVHGNQALDYLKDGPSVAHYKNDVFDVSEYIHEVVGLAIPRYPTCPKGQCKEAEVVREKMKELETQFQRADDVAASPFNVLKNLKM